MTEPNRFDRTPTKRDAQEPDLRVERCFATGAVQGTSSAGGLIGSVDEAVVIRDSYATGEVRAIGPSPTNEYAGGLVGSLESQSTVERSYFAGPLVSGKNAGGLLGLMKVDAALRDSFASSPVTGSKSQGGVVGDAAMTTPPVIEGAYWDATLAKVSVCIGDVPAGQPPSCIGLNTDGLSTALFQSPSEPPLAQWDFNGVWQSNPGKLPTLRPAKP